MWWLQLEIKQVLDMGVKPTDIIYAQTVKYPSTIKYCQEQGIEMMTWE